MIRRVFIALLGGAAAWPLDSAVGVEASFAGHFTRTLLVWIGSVHSLALGY
jgi:hypothetical protein